MLLFLEDMNTIFLFSLQTRWKYRWWVGCSVSGLAY